MKKYLKASSQSLRKVHIFIRLLAAFLLFFVDINLTWLIASFLCFLFYFTIAQSIMLHRYYSHKIFEFSNDFIRKLFVYITLISLRGSPIGWAYIHKLHHESVDSEKDPHSPHYKKVSILGLMDKDNLAENIQVFKIKSLLTRENLHINDYYWLYALSPILLALISIDVFFYFWLVPVLLFQVVSNFLNYANHWTLPGSYQNYQKDNTGASVNNPFLFFLSMGEAWHNNHHAYPGLANFGRRAWEIDPSYWIIKLVSARKNN